MVKKLKTSGVLYHLLTLLQTRLKSLPLMPSLKQTIQILRARTSTLLQMKSAALQMEFKAKITEIQESSDDLILTSENGTEKIQSGVENAKNLETRFESIKNASEITAESAEKITTIIQQQTSASEQILITLKQISAGVSNFSMATEYISKASENLKLVATELSASTQSSDSSDDEDKDDDAE